MARRADPTIDLCLGVIRQREAMRVRCKEEPDFVIGRKISWAFDGKSLLAFGATNDLSEFGMVQWKTKKPFSPEAGRLVGRRVRHGHVAAGPRGARRRALAGRQAPRLVALRARRGPAQLFFAKPDDFKLTDADRPGVQACKVIWRPDGRELVVVRADDCFGSDTGELVRLPVDSPRDQRSLKLGGDNPTFQPITG